MDEPTVTQLEQTPSDRPIDDMSMSDVAVDYSEIIEAKVFLGEYPYDAIVESLEKQFADYVTLEDRTDYVDIFYNQLHQSYRAIEEDDGEEHPVECKEALDRIHQGFIDFMSHEFASRLTVTIMILEEEDYDLDELELIIRKLYSFFILGARDNFMAVITADVLRNVESIPDDDEYFRRVNSMMPHYTPLFRTIGPMEFLDIIGDEEIKTMFTDNRVVGNFLRKYSPKLYNHPDFEVDIINNIVITQDIQNGIKNPMPVTTEPMEDET